MWSFSPIRLAASKFAKKSSPDFKTQMASNLAPILKCKGKLIYPCSVTVWRQFFISSAFKKDAGSDTKIEGKSWRFAGIDCLDGSCELLERTGYLCTVDAVPLALDNVNRTQY